MKVLSSCDDAVCGRGRRTRNSIARAPPRCLPDGRRFERLPGAHTHGSAQTSQAEIFVYRVRAVRPARLYVCGCCLKSLTFSGFRLDVDTRGAACTGDRRRRPERHRGTRQGWQGWNQSRRASEGRVQGQVAGHLQGSDRRYAKLMEMKQSLCPRHGRNAADSVGRTAFFPRFTPSPLYDTAPGFVVQGNNRSKWRARKIYVRTCVVFLGNMILSKGIRYARVRGTGP